VGRPEGKHRAGLLIVALAALALLAAVGTAGAQDTSTAATTDSSAAADAGATTAVSTVLSAEQTAAARSSSAPYAWIEVKPIGRSNANGQSKSKYFTIGQGRTGVIQMAMKYDHTTLAGGALTASITLPTGLTYVGVQADDRDQARMNGAFSCTTAGQVVTCAMNKSMTSTEAAAVQPNQVVELFLIVKAASNLVPTPPKDTPNPPDPSVAQQVSLGDISASLAVPTAAGVLNATSKVAAEAITGFVQPLMRSTIDATDSVGNERDFVIRLRNVGGLTAQSVGGKPSLMVQGILPEGIPNVDFTVKGDGWTCSDATGITICTYRRPIEIGAQAEYLHVHWIPLLQQGDRKAKRIKWQLSGKANWTTIADQGAKSAREKGTTCFSQRYSWKFHVLHPATMTARVEAAKGIDVAQGRTTRLRLRVRNTGDVNATHPGVRIALPKGVTLTSRTSGWTCTPNSLGAECVDPSATVAVGTYVTVDVDAATTTATPAVHGRITTTPYADNSRHDISHTVPFVVQDVGDPRIAPKIQFKSDGHTWKTWTDGGHTKVQKDESFTYRVQLVNHGGDAVPSGATVSISEKIGSGVKLIKVGVNGEGTCTSGHDVSCTLSPSSAIAPGQVVGTLDVTIVPTRETKDAALGPVVAKLSGDPGEDHVPVRLRVIASDRTIGISTTVRQIPDVGGRGELTMSATNKQRHAAIDQLKVSTTLPAGIALVSATGSNWTCSHSGRDITCAFDATLNQRTRTPKVSILVDASGKKRLDKTDWSATARTISTGHIELGTVHQKLPVRAPITIAASASPSTLAASKNAKALRTVVLKGSKSASNGVSLDYSWVQRCTTAADVKAFGKCPTKRPTPTVRVEHPHAATARALIPGVTERTTYVFELTISDHSSTRSQIVRTTAVPPLKQPQGGERSSSGKSKDAASKKAAQTAAQKAAEADRRKRDSQRRASAKGTQKANASKGKSALKGAPTVTIEGGSLQSAAVNAEVDLRAVVSGGTGERHYAWKQSAGSATTISDAAAESTKVHLPSTKGLVSYTVTVTDGAGKQGSARVTIDVGSDVKATDTTQALAASIVGGPSLGALPGTKVLLTALAQGGSGTVTYSWTQTAGPPVVLSAKTGSSASFTMPSTSEGLTFRVTATDGAGAHSTADATVTTQASPPTVSVAGGPLLTAAPSTETALEVRVSGGNGELKYKWTQISGAKTPITDDTSAVARIRTPSRNGLLVYTVTATDNTGTQGTGTVTVSVGAAAGKAYCSFLKQTAKASGSGSLDLPLGAGTTATFGTITPPSATQLSACSGISTKATRQTSTPSDGTPFSASTFTVGGVTIANAAGYVMPAGVEITSGTVTTPASWQLPAISIGTTPLSLVFAGGSSSNAELSGSITAKAFPFLTLPSGWTGTTTLTFTPNGGATTGAVDASATNGSGLVNVTGSLSTTGTFTASVTANDILTIAGTSLDMSGTTSNASGTTVSSISGSTTAATSLAPGVSLTTLKANWTTADTGPILTGSATVAFSTSGAQPANLNATLSYTDPADWNATLTGSGGASWQPLNGLTLTPSDFSGSIAQANGAWQWNVTATVPTWKAASVLTLTKTTLDLSSSCTATKGITCPKSMVFFNIDTTAVVDPPLSDPISISADAVFGLGGTPAFSMTATLSGSITAIPGLTATITNATVSVNDVEGTSLSPTITMPQASLSLPSAWRLPNVSITNNPLSLVFTTPSGGASSSGGSGSSGSSAVVAQLIGDIPVPQFPFLTLPTGWSGNANLSFGPTANVYGSATATASDGSHGVTVSGTLNTNGTYSASVSAEDIVTVGNASVNVAGTVTNTSGNVVSTVTGSIGSPATLASGVQLTTLSATWTSATTGPIFTGNATVAISSGSETPTNLNAAFTYTDTTNWNVTLTATGGPTWQPLPGLNVTPSDFSGSIGQTDAAWNWNVKAVIPTWTVSSVLTLNNTTLDMGSSCTLTNVVCPKADLFMMISTTANLNPPVGDSITADADAVFGIGGGAGFSLYADVPNGINVAPGLSFSNPSISVAYDLPSGSVTPTTGAPSFTGATENGWSINTAGGLTVPGLGDFAEIATNITSLGISMGGWDADGVSIASGNGSQSGTAFGYSSVPTTMSFNLPGFGAQSIKMTPGQISVTGGYSSPQWFSTLTGATLPNAISTIQFDPTTGFFNAIVDIPGSYSIPSGGSQIQMPSLNFAISNNAQGLTVTAGGVANLSAAAVGGGTSSPPQMSVEVSYDFTTEQVSASFGIENWQNAFGDQGLTINEAVITLGAELASVPFPTPTVALYANLDTGSLPPALTSAFGVPGNIPVAIGAELSEENPCIEVQVGSSTGTTPILSVGGGSLQATYFEFVIAPLGCTLGNVGGTPIVIPPGFSMAFDGQLFGTEVDVQAALSFDPTIFNASITVGAFTIPGTGGGMQFQQTTVTVSLNEQTQIDTVTFAGGFTMFGTTIDVSGDLSYDGATATTTAGLKVSQSQSLNVSGFSLSNLSIALNVTYGPSTNDLSIAASGDMDIMGNTVNVQAFDATIDNGVVENVNVQIQANLNFGPAATANGTFDMSYTQSTGAFDLNAAVVLTTAAGFSIGTPSNPATLEISPQCVAFSGSLAYAPFFTATMEGTLVYQSGCAETVTNSAGQQVQGSPGDFSFAATNVAIGIDGFGLTGDVGLGHVGSDDYANLNATIALSPQSTNNEITVNGDFNSNGNFTFNGSGNLDIAGFVMNMQVAVSNQNGNQSISGAANFDVGGTTLAFAGDFTMQNGQPSTSLTASANLVFDGFNLGNTTVYLNQTPSSFGMNAQIALNADLATLNGQLTFIENGGAPLFYLAAAGNLNIPDLADASMSGVFTNCTDPSCTQATTTTLTMSGSLDVYGITYNFPTIVIGADGYFSITSNSSGSSCTGTTEIWPANWQACFSYTETLLISDAAPYFSVSASADADVQVQWYNAFANSYSCACVHWPWWLGGHTTCLTCYSGGWGGWGTFINISGGFSFNADPFELSVEAEGVDFSI
jgi:hypothetical protein